MITISMRRGPGLLLEADAKVNPKHCARLNEVDCGQDCFHVGGDHGFVVVAEDDQRYMAVLSILLVSDTLIGSENGVEGGLLSGFEECPVGKPCPSLVRHSSDFMPCKQPPGLVGEILIEEDAHGSRWRELVPPKRRDRPSVPGSPRLLRSARAALMDSPRQVGPASCASGS